MGVDENDHQNSDYFDLNVSKFLQDYIEGYKKYGGRSNRSHLSISEMVHNSIAMYEKYGNEIDSFALNIPDF
jgi:hypothetical protein